MAMGCVHWCSPLARWLFAVSEQILIGVRGHGHGLCSLMFPLVSLIFYSVWTDIVRRFWLADPVCRFRNLRFLFYSVWTELDRRSEHMVMRCVQWCFPLTRGFLTAPEQILFADLGSQVLFADLVLLFVLQCVSWSWLAFLADGHGLWSLMFPFRSRIFHGVWADLDRCSSRWSWVVFIDVPLDSLIFTVSEQMLFADFGSQILFADLGTFVFYSVWTDLDWRSGRWSWVVFIDGSPLTCLFVTASEQILIGVSPVAS